MPGTSLLCMPAQVVPAARNGASTASACVLCRSPLAASRSPDACPPRDGADPELAETGGATWVIVQRPA